MSKQRPGVTIVPPLDHKFPDQPYIQIPVVLAWCLVAPSFLVGLPILLLVLLIWKPIEVVTLLFIYFSWVALFDSQSPFNGGWGLCGLGKAFFHLPIWQHYRNYFQGHLVKTADLPPEKNYIFMCHPHGVYCLGLFANITGNRSTFAKYFPGIQVYMTTLPLNFRFPGWREFVLSMAGVSVDRPALEALLVPPKDKKGEVKSIANPKQGRAVLLIVGGGEEYTYMEPQTLDLVLKKRKGFAKLALTTGTSLVPILTFGENDLYARIDTPFVRKMTAFTQRLAHFAFPAFKGRWGIVPNRIPLVTVVGEPLHVEKVEHPTHEQIDALHAKYLDHLTKLYEEYKDDFFKDRKRDMRFVKFGT
ncbi:diacylglycerol O-acyltransferase 1 [Blyttiomyces sp. JEL0837]|nr:diacylglycerol O-acyltransferase 1 [Blyttiomyces sp. JEL0837]